MVEAVLDDWRNAPVPPKVRAMLGFLEKLVHEPDGISASDVDPVLAAGVSREAVEDAIHVCALFSIYVRLADTFEFEIPDAHGFEMSSRRLLKRGYGSTQS